MTLQEIISANLQMNKKIGLSMERINPIKPELRKAIAFWREYPDLFIDFLQTGGNPDIEPKFKLFAYQRIFLRIGMRYKYVYSVFPRASSGANKFFH